MGDDEAGQAAPTTGSDASAPKSEDPQATAKDVNDEYYPSIPTHLQHFQQVCDALRDLADSLQPQAVKLDQRYRQRWLQLIDNAGFSQETQPLALMLLIHLLPRPASAVPTDGPLDERVREFLKGLTVTEDEERTSITISGEQLAPLLGDDASKFMHLLASLLMAVPNRTRAVLLNGSLLTTQVGALEVLIAGLAANHLQLHPDLLDQGDEKLSLKDLKAFTSVREAEKHVIDRRVEILMRGSLDDWDSWFHRHAGLGFKQFCDDLDSLREIMERRHTIVHNAGVVSRQYLSKTKSSGSIALGDHLPVTHSYLQDAIRQIDGFGTLLAMFAISKWTPEVRDIAIGFFNNRIYTFVEQQDWRIVRLLTSKGLLLKGTQEDLAILRVNQWLAIKRLEGPAAIESEVRAWDTTAMAHRFQFARACLLDDIDEAFRLLPNVVASGEAENLAKWPLCDELRSDARADSFGLLPRDKSPQTVTVELPPTDEHLATPDDSNEADEENSNESGAAD